MDLISGKQSQSESKNSLSAKALEYYRMYSGNDELRKYFCGSFDLLPHAAIENQSVQQTLHIPEIVVDDCEPATSPTSSVTSTRKLEWDSGADIGYANYNSKAFIQKSTSMPILERHEHFKLSMKKQDVDNAQSKSSEDASVPSTSNNAPNTSHRELMAFIRTKIGDPAAESTPTDRELHKTGSDPEIYTTQTPKISSNIKLKRFHTTSFNYEIIDNPSDHESSKIHESHTPKTISSGSDISDKTFDIREAFFTSYQKMKLGHMKISATSNVDCSPRPKTDCDAETQTSMMKKDSSSNSVAVQTSKRSSKHDVIYLLHPNMQYDEKTASTSSESSKDLAFSNCSSFAYISGRENDEACRKSVSSSSNSSKKSATAKNYLKLMKTVMNSKKCDEHKKELIFKQLAKKMLAQSLPQSSATSPESEKIVPQINNAPESNFTAAEPTSSNEESKAKDWRSSENETKSEKLISSRESSESCKEALISFAKKERESQLHWINNEIEHLSKLRTLLESKKKSNKNVHVETSISSTEIPKSAKSTAVYMITTQKHEGGNGHLQCEPKVIRKSDQSIDFYVHDALGSRDYQFKEIITKITPNENANPIIYPLQNLQTNSTKPYSACPDKIPSFPAPTNCYPHCCCPRYVTSVETQTNDSLPSGKSKVKSIPESTATCPSSDNPVPCFHKRSNDSVESDERRGYFTHFTKPKFCNNKVSCLRGAQKCCQYECAEGREHCKEGRYEEGRNRKNFRYSQSSQTDDQCFVKQVSQGISAGSKKKEFQFNDYTTEVLEETMRPKVVDKEIQVEGKENNKGKDCISAALSKSSDGLDSGQLCHCCGKMVSESSSSNENASKPTVATNAKHSHSPYESYQNGVDSKNSPKYALDESFCDCRKSDNRVLLPIIDTLRQLVGVDSSEDIKAEREIKASDIRHEPQKDNDSKQQLAYVLNFENRNNIEKKVSQHQRPLRIENAASYFDPRNPSNNTNEVNDDARNLQDYLSSNRPDFVKSAEERRRCLIAMAHNREKRCEKFEQFAISGNIPLQNSFFTNENRRSRLFTTKEMKKITATKYKKLPEVQQKLQINKTNRIKRANRILVEIFNKNLRECVLRGQPSLSTSVNVINL